MPNIEVRGKYRTFRYDGTTPLDFTPYNNSIFLIRRPNPTTFVTLQQYVPGQGGVFTTFLPGSSYTIVTNADGSQDFNFDMGPYTRVDRLPSSTTIKSPNFYIGLDKNSIAVPISSYALGSNPSLISVVNILYINGQGNRLQYLAADSFRTGAPINFTHFLPNSGYELRNSTPYTFFAPLQSEMGDAYATGYNTNGEYGMGYRHDNNSFPGDNIYGIWDKIVFNNNRQQVTWNGQSFNTGSIAALSSCGNSKALFVLGSNLYGQLGTGSNQQYYPTWTRVSGQWADIEMGIQHMVATNTQGHLYACGSNQYGQLGLGSGVANTNTLTLVDNTRNYVQLATSFNSTMVRDSNGFLYACGSNGGGILGLGNKTSPVYSLTQEALGLYWSDVKGHKSSVGFLAISNKKLYGSSPYNTWNFGYTSNNTMLFKQEGRGWTDIITVDTGYEGTFIRRVNQNNFYATGLLGATSDNNLALIDPSGTSARYLYAFKETTVPSSASSISLHLKPGTTPNGGLTVCDLLYALNSKLYYKNPGNTFVQTSTNAFNIFAGTSNAPVFVLLDGNRFRPTPTPTPTITLTPSPVPFQPYNVSQIGIFASEGRGPGDSIMTNSYVNGIPGALNNALTQTFFVKVDGSSVFHHAYDYEKGSIYNRVVGIGIDVVDFNNNYPRYLYYHGGPYPGTKMSTEFNRGRDSSSYGFDALMIAPPDPGASVTSQGIYLYAYYFRYSSAKGEYRLATSFDRGVTWPLYGTFYDMETAYYNVSNGSRCRPVFSMSRQRTATSRFEVRLLFNGNFDSNTGDLHSRWPRGLVCKVAYPSGTGSLETVYNQIDEYGRPTYEPFGYAFKHDYFNIPTAVSIGDDSVIRNNKILIHRRINGTWITDTVLSNITNASDRVNFTGSIWGAENNMNLISIEFNPTNPDIIYIAYMLGGGNENEIPKRINVITYNMHTKTLIQDQKVISTIAGDPGYVRITNVGAFTVPLDGPTLFYDTIAQRLYLYCYVAMINAEFKYYDTVFTTNTSDNTNWSALVQFNPTCVSSGRCLGRFRSNWDFKTKY